MKPCTPGGTAAGFMMPWADWRLPGSHPSYGKAMLDRAALIEAQKRAALPHFANRASLFRARVARGDCLLFRRVQVITMLGDFITTEITAPAKAP